MSANFLLKVHIDVLLTAALAWGRGDEGFRYYRAFSNLFQLLRARKRADWRQLVVHDPG